jgi:hypothetical protein
MKTSQIGRSVAIGCVMGLMMLWVGLAAGLRINGTASFPVGLYLAIGKSPEKGDLVFVDPPSLPLFALAKARGYLGAGFSPAGCSALIKRLADKLIAQLQEGTAPWQKPWVEGQAFGPYNPTTGNRYRGINVLALLGTDYTDPRWMTYKQAQAQGWQGAVRGNRGPPGRRDAR